MKTSRCHQSVAFALALTVTLGVLGGLNALANDLQAAQSMAKAINPHQTQATATVTSKAAALQVASLGS